jgi:hypothetical protein
MQQQWRSTWVLPALHCTSISMEMAPPKRWARCSSVGALVHSPEHVADSLLLSREAYTVETVGLGLLTAALLLCVLYEA